MSRLSAEQYMRTRIVTASPEQLQLMLFDGAIRFARQGRDALADNKLETSHQKLLGAQKIVMELNCNPRHDVEPTLRRRLAALYDYIYRLLVEANFRRSLAAADEAIKLLEYQRETWVLLLAKLAAESVRPYGAAAETTPPGGPPQRGAPALNLAV